MKNSAVSWCDVPSLGYNSGLFSLEMIGSVSFKMLELSRIRLLLRGFLMAWYFMCGLASFVGMVIFTLSLASMLNIFGDQLKMESSWQVVGISLVFIFVSNWFRFHRSKLDSTCPGSVGRDGKAETNPRSLMTIKVSTVYSTTQLRFPAVSEGFVV